MSKQAVESILGKAILDGEFRAALFADPEEALAAYELTEMEVAALKAIDVETLESFAGTLDERISKADYMGMISTFDGIWAGDLPGMESWRGLRAV